MLSLPDVIIFDDVLLTVGKILARTVSKCVCVCVCVCVSVYVGVPGSSK